MLCLLMALLILPVSARTAEQYDPLTEGIVSDYYVIDPEADHITGIVPGTKTDKLLSLCAPEGLTAEGETVCTGTTVKYGDTVSATAVVTGDLNGDGGVSISDLLMLKSAVLGKQLEALSACAGDVNYDSKVSVTDFLKVKSVLLGQQSITGRPGVREDLLLLQPGQSRKWEQTAVTYQSDNEAVVTVDARGMLTACNAGVGFVYGLDAEGNILCRQLVTVCEEALTVTVAEKDCRLYIGSSQTLTALLNHPVSATVTWTSSDPKVATVEDGKVTAVFYGRAVITASLENGSKAELTVEVAPALDSITFDRALYKVKPDKTKKPVITLQPADSSDELIFTSSDDSIATVAADGTVTGKKYGTVTVTVTGKYSGVKASCKVKVCNVKQVAFTFDDGPSVYTPKLLDFCKENDIRVTFFLVGNRLSSYKNTVKQMAADGHEIGYHSYGHENQTRLSTERVKADFEKSNKKLKELTGQGFTLWRTPGGNYNDRVLQAIELPHIFWSRDSHDWQVRNTDTVYRNIRNARDGDIVLMHDLYSFTVNGAMWAMKEMQAGDYEFVTVTELLSRNGEAPKNSVNYRKGP